ncbi:PaaI family thioesterase [Rhodococcus ruber]|uniref:Acyl-coenzyme A thioesterase THEM4 n=1 Tax=Rhodococcus ruber TaxID=1830 RepID=A0A098BEI8_9NOCA|nr:PaaI family thioesterase [Rhodococcus ruber]MCD2129565.1 PaaI family thioesterase [Rhodococcus ruber]MCZ4506057.1 PaaI family thioesterase [Rhodococcus ruber]MCZ4533158.1 PaaI family thioesterase [Rhodococcus ruber]MCZ4623577.1 PaaI family thioesterase [Rhodococcus ruber]MDI9970654.1 PaaI family thioesterase [Rhodococcus ruber]
MSDTRNHADTATHPTWAEWSQAVQRHGGDSAELPPHHPRCLGCGPANPHGHHLRALRGKDGVFAYHVFDERHIGAPGIAHGGAVATIVDDLFGFLLYVVGELAVTRCLNVEYLRPVLLNIPYSLCAELTSREGRKLHLRAQIENAAGQVVAISTAMFVVVDLEHFTIAQPGTQAPR